MGQEFRVSDYPSQSSARVFYGIIGDIDSLDRGKKVASHMKKKAMGATDFK
jgi:hypothetical protein